MEQPSQLIRFRQKGIVTVGGGKFLVFAADAGPLQS
jgi:hypothetical protein